MSGTAKTPADFLKAIRGRPVVVKLNSGVDYRGMPTLLHQRSCFLCFVCTTWGRIELTLVILWCRLEGRRASAIH